MPTYVVVANLIGSFSIIFDETTDTLIIELRNLQTYMYVH